MNHTEQFAKNKEVFLKGKTLNDWELAALKSYDDSVVIRKIIGFLIFILILAAVFNVFKLGKTSELNTHAVFDALWLLLVTILAVTTYFFTRWWMAMITALAVFPLGFSIITWSIGGFLLLTIPLIKRANREFNLSHATRRLISLTLSTIAKGKRNKDWPEIGRFGNKVVRIHIFDNQLLFLARKVPLNAIPNCDAEKCVLEPPKKNKFILKSWPVRGKIEDANIQLTDEGYELLQLWLRTRANPAVAI